MRIQNALTVLNVCLRGLDAACLRDILVTRLNTKFFDADTSTFGSADK